MAAVALIFRWGAVCLLLALLAPLTALGARAAVADFEEDVSLGLSGAQLKKLGAVSCSQAALCLNVRWNNQPWKAALRLQADKLDMVELQPSGKAEGQSVRAQLDEFALSPVLVVAGAQRCDAFALVKSGLSVEKAVVQCATQLERLPQGTDFSVWYVDEDEVEALLKGESLEKAVGARPATVGARLSVSGSAVEVGYGTLGNLLQPTLKP